MGSLFCFLVLFLLTTVRCLVSDSSTESAIAFVLLPVFLVSVWSMLLLLMLLAIVRDSFSEKGYSFLSFVIIIFVVLIAMPMVCEC